MCAQGQAHRTGISKWVELFASEQERCKEPMQISWDTQQPNEHQDQKELDCLQVSTNAFTESLVRTRLNEQKIKMSWTVCKLWTTSSQKAWPAEDATNIKHKKSLTVWRFTNKRSMTVWPAQDATRLNFKMSWTVCKLWRCLFVSVHTVQGIWRDPFAFHWAGQYF